MGEIGFKTACYQRHGVKLYALARGEDLLWLGYLPPSAFFAGLGRADLSARNDEPRAQKSEQILAPRVQEKAKALEPNEALARQTARRLMLQEDAAHFAVLFGLLDEYFDGRNPDFFARLDLKPKATSSAFSQSVWAQIAKIPYGKTFSYAQLARAMGSKAHRAVGTACGKNPFAIIIPCHRVIRADGSPGAYGGGADLKKQLLELERDF